MANTTENDPIKNWENDLLLILDKKVLNENNAIVKNNFDNIDKKFIKRVIGEDVVEWDRFRTIAPDILKRKYGLTLTKTTGAHGPLKPTLLTVPKYIGVALAEKLHKQKETNGDAKNILFNKINKLKSRIDEIDSIDLSNSNLRDFGTGFSSVVKNHKRFSLSKGFSFAFNLTNDYIYYKPNPNSNQKTEQRESKLEQRLTKEGASELTAMFGRLWNSDVESLANKNGIGSGALLNADIVIAAKRRLVEKDELRIAALEVKADNTEQSLFKALSQASSYRAIANEVWIVAPGLRNDEFKSAEQHHSFINQCRDNGFGVITLDLNQVGDDLEDAHELVLPNNQPIMNSVLQRQTLDGLRWRYCVKCGRFYSETNGYGDEEFGEAEDGVAVENISDCGWVIGEKGCARILEERMLAQCLDTKSSEGPSQ